MLPHAPLPPPLRHGTPWSPSVKDDTMSMHTDASQRHHQDSVSVAFRGGEEERGA